MNLPKNRVYTEDRIKRFLGRSYTHILHMRVLRYYFGLKFLRKHRWSFLTNKKDLKKDTLTGVDFIIAIVIFAASKYSFYFYGLYFILLNHIFLPKVNVLIKNFVFDSTNKRTLLIKPMFDLLFPVSIISPFPL